ncbi:MAG: Gfo/Idh/MocA family oxidoreductase [Thermoguttaceae bacterium]|nr:Gfo/Idh/MocA family oxidoreductase [Thermoguttaceae bacterium]MDW8037552.1 Gfo/Idh/MocA family oxidoreductase [Thermoguttaceae bacterium]
MAVHNPRVDRRRFLSGTVLGWGLPVVLAGRSWAANSPPPSQQVTVAVIGTGSRGMGLLEMVLQEPRCRVLALCDVDKRHLAAAAKRVPTSCQTYTDFRRILDRQDIDAVVLGTPDHWHAVMTVLACQAGKDVYCEKPLARTIGEGQAMIQAARRYGRMVQMGSQYRSMARTRQVCEWVRNGRLGKVQEVRLTHAPNPARPCQPPQPVPPELDWDMWLGPAPWAPYHPARCHFTFRYFMDYGSGALADNGVHMFGVVSWALGADHSGPVRIQATGRQEPNNLYDVPVEMEVRFEFAEPPCTVIWEQKPGHKLNIEFIGQQATLSGFWEFQLTQGQADLSPTRPNEIQLERSDNHLGNWIDSIQSRQLPVYDVEIGHRVTVWSHLGNIAYRLGRPLQWDPAKEQFPGDEEANRLLHVAYRPPWQI